MTRRALLGTGASLLGASATAAPQRPALQRGVSLSSWFANAPRQPLIERDFKQIAAAGFDHVRLPVNPETIGYRSAATAALPSPDPVQARWGPVDKAITLATSQGLPVVFDIHPDSAGLARLETEPWTVDDLVAFVRAAGRRYASISPSHFAIELLNEPQFYQSPEAYQALATRLVGAARSELPRHTLLLGGPYGNSIKGLLALQPIDDADLVYTFHYYLPYVVTHQGINHGFQGTEVRAFHGLPYPASRVDRSIDYAPQAIDPARAWRELQAYLAEDWGPARILQALQPAAAWAATHGARLLCTEFGAFRAFIDPVSRYAWIGDARRGLEQLGLGWTVWDYADVFGITVPVGATVTNPADQSVTLIDPSRGERRLEPEALASLGLRPG